MSHLSRARLRRWSLALVVALPTVVLAPIPALAGVAPGTAPTITAPTDLATITTKVLTVTATSTATHVKFVVDGRSGEYEQLVPVAGGEASAQFSLLGLTGDTPVEAFDCEVGGSCNVSGPQVNVTVDLTDPVITSPDAGDVVGGKVIVKATAPGGGLQFFVDGTPVGKDLEAPFERTISLGTKKDGQHTLAVRQCNDTGTVCDGDTDQLNVIKDTRGPRWSELSTSQRTVFPVKDRYKDSTRLSARVGERSLETKVEIRKAGGPLVRTLKLGRVDQGRVAVNWNGRRSNGDIVPKGKYTFQFIGTDVHGVVGKSNDKVVYVSDKKLVKKNVTKTVSAWGSKISKFAGSCSSVVKVGSGTVGLRSNSKDNCTGDASIAATQHAIKIGKAKKYGNLKISVYGQGVTKNAPTAIMFNVRSNGDVGGKTRVGGSKGWTAGDSVSLEKYLNGAYVSWVILTGGGNSYDAIKFKIQYTVTVLQ